MKHLFSVRFGAFAEKAFKKRSRMLLAAAVVSLLLSFPAAATAWGGDDDRLAVLDPALETGTRNSLDGWQVKTLLGRPDFELVETEIGKAIHLRSRSSSMVLLGRAEYDIKKYPVMRWKWMVKSLPEGASAGDFYTNDMAIHIYVVIKKWPESINTRRLGYVWDSTMQFEEIGDHAVVPSPVSIGTKYMVLQSGARLASRWVSEERNIYEDYKRLFNEEPPGPASISIMIDSDDTRSFAESFIGDIYLTGETRPSK